MNHREAESYLNSNNKPFFQKESFTKEILYLIYNEKEKKAKVRAIWMVEEEEVE